MTTKVEMERYGRILAGFYEGYFVRIRDDSEVTGGYYIYLVDDLAEPTDGGDYWVADKGELESFVESSQWEIEWLPE
ncbi:hypothetical protein GTY75_30230 [Streptomyces sp. SID8381]|uniref:hypothetical protein n=1 Tax=unclassified Streptomyces TaxID=2593676 RepID=UPI000366C5CF|nr:MULTISPECIES: hypothetical protein [unclassified Streptomyces]MYX30853.1 hypothetical protein [Streptomyces sp. SID8381]